MGGSMPYVWGGGGEESCIKGFGEQILSRLFERPSSR
jgi:hypothetical protein